MSPALIALTLVSNLGLAETYRVVGGKDAPAGHWPDTAAVFFGAEQGCTGVLIAPDLVLTAGHCAGGITHVLLDTIDYTQGGEKIEVVETIVQQNWSRTYDLSLLILAEESSVEPRVIAQGCALDNYLYDGAEVVIVGYGATDVWGERYGSRLQQAQTTVIDAECTDMELGCASQVSPGGELRAGGDGVDACFGDSGGPLYLVPSDHAGNTSSRMDYNIAARQADPEAYLVGITSRGYDTAYQPCSEGGIYVRPDAVIAWIEESAGVELPEPDCAGEPNAEEETVLYPVSGCSHVPAPGGIPGLGLLALGLGLAVRRR